MKKQRFQYGISGYRWAPESFRAIKGLVGQTKKEIPLTKTECCEVGYQFLTEGFRSAVGYVKRIERMKARRERLYMTYGFWLIEEPGRYLYYPQTYCPADAPLAVRFDLFKAIRDDLVQKNCQMETSTQCELDGAFRPINVKVNKVTADLSRPLVVWLRSPKEERKLL